MDTKTSTTSRLHVPRSVDAPSLGYANLTVGRFRRRDDYRVVRPAGTDDFLMILGNSGRGLIQSQNMAIQVLPRQIVLLKPEHPHDYGTDPKCGIWGLLWAHFHPPAHWMPLLGWNEIVPGVLLMDLRHRTAATQRVLHAFHEMHLLASSNLPRRNWLAMNALETLLLRCDAMATHPSNEMDSRLETVVHHIQTHISDPLYLPELANMVHLSVSQLSALFRQNLKMSPHAYVEAQRMDVASRLLQYPSLSIKEVAFMSGFQDALYFSKRFRRHLKLTPSRFREECSSR